MIVLVMGVSGSGKTTVGTLLARDLGWPFYDADDFHPPDNIGRMQRGEALTDDHRKPWLGALRALIDRLVEEGRSAVIACSALKASYREDLVAGHDDDVEVVYLRGEYERIMARMNEREHFFPPDLLQSQFDVLEEPSDAVRVDIDAPPGVLVQQIRRALHV